MNTICFLRHYIKNNDSLLEFCKIVKRVLKVSHLKDISFSILLNLDKDTPKAIVDSILKEVEKLVLKNISISITRAIGAGHAFFDILEESISSLSSSKERNTIFLIDGDQFDVSSDSFLRSVRKMRDYVVKEDAIIGIARRNTVNLAKDRKLQVYREIEEVIHGLYIKKKVVDFTPKNRLKKLGVNDSYKDICDPVPGCYCINIMHKNFFPLLERIRKDSMVTDLNRYAGDPYIVMLSSKYGKIVSYSFDNLTNPPSSFNVGTITDKHKNLSRTVIAKDYLRLIKSKSTDVILARYYNLEDILYVKKLMLKGFVKK